jgi:hypothetical protein
MPFAERSFDVVWSQSVAMNIADRDRLNNEPMSPHKTEAQEVKKVPQGLRPSAP